MNSGKGGGLLHLSLSQRPTVGGEGGGEGYNMPGAAGLQVELSIVPLLVVGIERRISARSQGYAEL